MIINNIRINNKTSTIKAVLIHANIKWITTNTPNLCPYSLHMANDIYNDTSSLQSKARRLLINIFANIKVAVNHTKIASIWMSNICSRQ